MTRQASQMKKTKVAAQSIIASWVYIVPALPAIRLRIPRVAKALIEAHATVPTSDSSVAMCVDQWIEGVSRFKYCSTQSTSAYGDDEPHVNSPITAGMIGFETRGVLRLSVCDAG